MKWKVIGVLTAVLVIISYCALTVTNPGLADYQQGILNGISDQEAELLAAADRKAIELEAVRLTSEFMAVRYNPHRLDAARIQRNHPLLGPSLSHLNESEGRSLTENLTISRDQALKRVRTTRETMRYSILRDLTMHTTRTSYGLWSNFSTCFEKKAFSYTGIAGRFYERTDLDCLAAILPQ